MVDHVHERAKLLAAEKAGSGVVDDGVRVVDTDLTASRCLYFNGSHPRTVDVLICMCEKWIKIMSKQIDKKYYSSTRIKKEILMFTPQNRAKLFHYNNYV